MTRIERRRGGEKRLCDTDGAWRLLKREWIKTAISSYLADAIPTLSILYNKKKKRDPLIGFIVMI